MTQHRRRAKSGDPLQIPANTFNSLIDAAEDFQAKSQSGGGPITPTPLPPGQILVKNASSRQLKQYQILGLGSPSLSSTMVIPPPATEDSLPAFGSNIIFKAKVVNADEQNFVVTDEPIAPDAI